MIDKVQYSDFNRFLVSTGYVLIALGLLLPYFYLRESFDLQIELTRIQLLTPTARQVITQKQLFSLWLIKTIPWLSLFSVLIGVGFLFIGGNRWRKRQIIEDEKVNEEISKLKTENKKATFELESSLKGEKVSQEEVLEIRQKEIQKEQPLISSNEIKLSAQAYFAVEGLIAEKFKKEFSDRYNVLTNYRINNIEFDLILSQFNYDSKGLGLRKDVIIEIKYSVKKITSQYVIETLKRISSLIDNYPKAVTHPIVFFVMSEYNSFNEDKIREEIIHEWSQKTINKWNLIFTDLKDLSEMVLKSKINI